MPRYFREWLLAAIAAAFALGWWLEYRARLRLLIEVEDSAFIMRKDTEALEAEIASLRAKLRQAEARK